MLSDLLLSLIHHRAEPQQPPNAHLHSRRGEHIKKSYSTNRSYTMYSQLLKLNICYVKLCVYTRHIDDPVNTTYLFDCCAFIAKSEASAHHWVITLQLHTLWRDDHWENAHFKSKKCKSFINKTDHTWSKPELFLFFPWAVNPLHFWVLYRACETRGHRVWLKLRETTVSVCESERERRQCMKEREEEAVTC